MSVEGVGEGGGGCCNIFILPVNQMKTELRGSIEVLSTVAIFSGFGARHLSYNTMALRPSLYFS